jgi:hypothetical protein
MHEPGSNDELVATSAGVRSKLEAVVERSAGG